MVESIYSSIGIFGGSFDPPHVGHLKISKISLKQLKIKKLYWVITKKNPLKKKPYFILNKRILKCQNMVKKVKKIKVEYLDDKINSSKTIDIVKYFKKKNKCYKIYLIIGSDNLLNFHKWDSWKQILKLCELVVFSRKGYDTNSKKSVIINYLKNKNITFVKNKKINISSTIIRKKLKNKN